MILRKPPRSKRVTLIAAARTPEGIIIHADSQETVGDYRIEVDKIVSEQMGDFQVLIAGAGSPSALIDSFPTRLRRRINSRVQSLERFATVTEKVLARFYEHDVDLCPDQDKNVSYLIAAYYPKTRQYQAWTTANVSLLPIPANTPILMGWEHALYINIAKRFYYPATTAPQAIVAGVYLMTIAEETANCVKGPIKIAVVNNDGITLEEPGYARRLQDRLTEYESKANKVFLECADTTVSLPELEDALNQFRQTALDLHREQIDAQAVKSRFVDLLSNNPLRRLPNVPMILTDDGKWLVEHDRSSIQKARDEQKERDEWVKNSGIESLSAAIQCSKCQYKFEAKMPCGGPHDHSFTGSCPNCTTGYQVSWVYESGSFSERLTE
jgi:hypothetical protein